MHKNNLIRALSLGLFFSLIFLLMPAPAPAQVAVGIAVSFGPPDIPVYDQPPCPSDGYLWTPGYWAWDPDAGDYYWVPGTWIEPPQVGFLWTPGYWAWRDTGFFFTDGYWGPVVGFYGGINYGFGYFGRGFEGGRWEHDHFFYNRAVVNVNVTVIHNVYETRVENINNTRVSFNGGRGGIEARATAEEEAAARERHVGAVAAQTRHIEDARKDQQLRSKFNHGAPPVAATAKPGDFKGKEVVKAREAGALHNEGDTRAGNTGGAKPETGARVVGEGKPVHPKDLAPAEKRPAPNTGNAKMDQKYQQQQEKLAKQQEADHQKLQAKQDADHAKLQKQQANEARQQQLEQKHQQQTQQLEQKHTQQSQKMEQRQAPKPKPSNNSGGNKPQPH